MEELVAAFPDMKLTTERAFGQGEWIASESLVSRAHKGARPSRAGP